MTEGTIRPYRPGDVGALRALWREVFGDSEALTGAFFRLLPGMGGGLVAERDGAVAGMAFLIDGLWLVDSGGRERRCGYLYAVAVSPRYRGAGLGAALSRAAFDLGRERGAEILCTEPAEPGLFDWYACILGVTCALRRRRETIPAAPGPEARHEAEDYGQKREALLANTPHLRPGYNALAFEWFLCADSGGGFYALEGGAIAAAYREGEQAVIRELLAPEGVDRRAAAAALARQLGAREALLYSADEQGEPYLAAYPGLLPEDTVWDLSFD